MKFDCTKCGLCCKSITKEFGEMFGVPVREGGGCGHLNEKLECDIYESRPLVCRVDELHEKVFFKDYSLEKWHDLQAAACKELQDEDERKTNGVGDKT